MIVKEFRVLMNMTVDEYQRAEDYSVMKAEKNETGGGEGVEVLVSEPFTAEEGIQPRTPMLGGKFTEGYFTHKIYHLKSKVPWFIRQLAPNGALELHAEGWNAYPYGRSLVSNPDFLRHDFYLTVDALHVADRGEQHNALELTQEELARREVIYIDIANDTVQSKDYKMDEDPTKYRSGSTGRGPLTKEWQNTVSPMMCAYKVVKCHFNWFGLQTIVERTLMKTQRRLILNLHRQMFCWTDEWYGLSKEDLKRLQDEAIEESSERLHEGNVIGTIGDEEDV